MIDFPGFDKRVAEIQAQNGDAIDLARRMLQVWVTRPIDRWLFKSDLSDVSLSLSFMLNYQATRQFRSVVELCKIGEGANAAIIGRSLIETVLAAHFVLSEQFYVVVYQKRGRSHGNPPKRDLLKGKWATRPRNSGERGRTMTREKRALIFQAHCMSQGYNIANGIRKRVFEDTGELLALDPKPLRDARNRIGRKWKYIQSEHPHTYSGLNVKQLAVAAGSWFPTWYESMYTDQSRFVHGVDPISYLNIDRSTGEVEFSWFSNDHKIKETLYCANMLFVAFTNCLSENINLGSATDMLVTGFFDDMKQVYKPAPTV